MQIATVGRMTAVTDTWRQFRVVAVRHHAGRITFEWAVKLTPKECLDGRLTDDANYLVEMAAAYARHIKGEPARFPSLATLHLYVVGSLS